MEGMVAAEVGSWRGRAVFVTGATGVIGSWLVKALLSEGANVVALVSRIQHCERALSPEFV